MSVYTTDAAGALADVAAAGAAVTFTRTAQTISATTGLSTPSESSIAGYAIEKSSGESDAYEALSLVRSAAPLLLFTPSVAGSEVQVGDTCTWASQSYTARSVRHLRIDGTIILSYVVIAI